ncbi:MAG: hypothetical protein ACREVH_02480, partial [Gammaproteobacteria bacterium]
RLDNVVLGEEREVKGVKGEYSPHTMREHCGHQLGIKAFSVRYMPWNTDCAVAFATVFHTTRANFRAKSSSLLE